VCTKNRFAARLPGPVGAAYSTPPDSLAGYIGEGKVEGKGEEGDVKGKVGIGKGEGRKGRERAGREIAPILISESRHVWTQLMPNPFTQTHTHRRPFVRDYPGRPVLEETFTHSHPS